MYFSLVVVCWVPCVGKRCLCRDNFDCQVSPESSLMMFVMAKYPYNKVEGGILRVLELKGVLFILIC